MRRGRSATLTEFLAMGGYGFYVWGAYGVTALVIAIEIVSLRARRRRALEEASSGGFDNPAAVPAPEIAP